MHFLRILEDGKFGFVVDGIHEILETDIDITDEDYIRYFELENTRVDLKLKETLPQMGGLFDYIDIVTIIEDTIEKPKTEIEVLQEDLLNTKLAMAEIVEQQQADKLNAQLAMAELIETIMAEGGGTE
jgi:hypothetical protein